MWGPVGGRAVPAGTEDQGRRPAPGQPELQAAPEDVDEHRGRGRGGQHRERRHRVRTTEVGRGGAGPRGHVTRG